MEKILKENNNNSKDNVIINIRNELVNGNLDSIISDIIIKEKKDLVIKENNIVYQITSSNNENNTKNNISTIKLGECEEKLRQENNINDDITLIILKIEIYEEGLLIPIIEYEVYNSETKEKLDLKICKDIKIQINIPVSIDENNLFKYNSSHEYYNDICYTYTTNNKTDIILNDRRNEYKSNNMSLCENNCEFSYYDSINKNSVCDCKVKVNVKFPLKIEINTDVLVNNFINIKQLVNFNIMKCYETLFNKEGLKNNIGNYILSFNTIILVVLTIFFKIKGYDKLKEKINQIINIKKEKENNNKIVNINITKNKKKIRSNVLNINKMNNNNINIISNDISINSKSNIRLGMKKKFNKIEFEKITFQNSTLVNSSEYNNIMDYNDYELNGLSYRKALKVDKRTYFQYYFSLLKRKHIIIFAFYTYDDYNSKTLKIILLLFSFVFYYAINALFFNDSTMHRIYIDEGRFNFIYQIPQIIYSNLICSIINKLITFLSLSEKNVLQIKNEEKDFMGKASKIINCLIIKFISFFILCYIFFILFWYYLSCFSAVYKNTQLYLLEDTLISYGLSLIYPFVIYLLPGSFRIPALLESRNRIGECLYKLSRILEFI